MKLSAAAIEWIAVAIVISTAMALAVFGVWIFRIGADATEASIPRLILSDRATLGFVRLLAAAAALYGLASITVMIMRGRWLRSISTAGFEADTPEDSDRTLRDLAGELRHVRSERNRLERLLMGGPDG